MKEKKIIQITSGRGPAECCWVVAQATKKLLQEAKDVKLSAQVISKEDGVEKSTLFSAVIMLEGTNVNVFLKNWLGTVQWIGQSKFRKFHKRKNWFVGVEEVQSAMFNVQSLRDIDVRWETFRSSGAGGQHVNKVESAVRVIHIPSGVTATSSESRSQFQNKKSAMEKLKEQLKLEEIKRYQHIQKNTWQQHNELERGNAVRVFYEDDFKEKRIKDD